MTPRARVQTVTSVRELFEEKSEPPAQPADNRRFVIEVFLLLATLVTALANFFGQATGWFRWVTAVLAVVVIGWVASQLITWGRTVLAGHRERVALTKAVRLLHNEFTDLIAHFSRYADNTRADTIPRFMIQLVMEEKVDLPIADTSVYHVWRLYETLREQVAPVTKPAGFKNLVQEFGEILHLYHSLYVLKPYDRVRSTDISKLSPYAQTRVREELPVLREDYNDFIRLTNSFGERVKETFEDSVFPAHLERLKPLSG